MFTTRKTGTQTGTEPGSLTRRTLMQRSAAGAGALVAVSATSAVSRAASGIAGHEQAFLRAQEQPSAGGTLIFNGGSNLSGLDPHTVGAVVSWYVLDNIFDRLMRLNAETQEPEPSLAEKVDVSADGLTYTFTLRKGVTFHNGRELTSDDVKKSFERIQNPDVPAVAKGYFANLASIETPDPGTVVLVYSKPYAALLTALTRLETSIVPMEEVEKTEEWDVHPVGSGPFVFESYTKDQAAKLTRNENYWEPDLPHLAGIEQRVIPQPETPVINAQTGDVHVTPVPPSSIDSLANEESLKVNPVVSNYWAHLSLNNRVAPFDDVKVRQAIRLAVNRNDIRDLAFFGTGVISNTLIPEQNPFRAEVEGWEYDADKARSLLQETGHGDGFSATIRVNTADAWQLPTAELIQAYLADIGITIEIEQIESTTWFSDVFTNHNFEMSMTSHVSKVDPDLSMFDILHSGELGTKNYTGFSDPEMDDLLDRGRTSTDTDERKSIYAQAQQIFVERSGYIVLNLQTLPFAVNNAVQDFLLLPTSELRWKGTSLTA